MLSMRGFIRGHPADFRVTVSARVVVFVLAMGIGSSGLLVPAPVDEAGFDPAQAAMPGSGGVEVMLAEADDVGVPVELVPEPTVALDAFGEPPPPSPTASPTEPPPAPFKATRFTIATLPTGQRPYDADATLPLTYRPQHHDAAGVPLQLVNGRLVYQPAGLAQLAIRYVSGYRKTHDPRYLARADAIGDVFLRVGRSFGGGLYIPYRFSFAMHHNPADIVRNPWYSAMAQGLALSLFSRLYQETADPSYLATAERLYRSLRHIGRGTNPWVSYIDASRYLWLEEYAQPYPEHTLNGFNFALFGLYDWYLTTGDPDVLQTLRGALTTLKANVLRYRNPGGPSDYCLKHGKAQDKYHHIHIWQLRFMTAISGDAYFARVADLFARDA